MTVPKDAFELRAAPPARGVLWASVPDGRLEGRRVLPAPDLAPFVHHYGSVQWDLRSPYVAETLPHPAARIEFEAQGEALRAQVAGVRTRRFGGRRTDRGRFFVVQFRAAAFQPLLRAALSGLTDRTVPAVHVFGARAEDWARQLQRARCLHSEITLTEAFLREVVPPMPPAVAAMRDLVEHIAASRALTRVDQVAAVAGLDVRTLQRRFRSYVGVHPKWVIQRYRLLEAAERLRAGAPVTLARLAFELGYADQAQLARDFRRVVGRPPGLFARAQSAGRRP